MDLMIDIETLGTGTKCVVLSIGACFFDFETKSIGGTFSCILEVDGQLKLSREIDYSTLKWWIFQDDKAKKIFKGNQSEVKTALIAFNNFIDMNLKQNNDKKLFVWGNGSTFDISIMESLFKDFEVPTPWNYGSIMDFRTYRRFLANNEKIEKSERTGVHHDALSDAISQANFVLKHYKG